MKNLEKLIQNLNAELNKLTIFEISEDGNSASSYFWKIFKTDNGLALMSKNNGGQDFLLLNKIHNTRQALKAIDLDS